MTLGLVTGFPFACRTATFHLARLSAREDAERDWKAGDAIWYARPEDPLPFGASTGCYSVDTGLRIQSFKPGVTAGIYCKAYRAVVPRKLAHYGPTNKLKSLCTEADVRDWIKSGRFRRAERLPLTQGRAEIWLNGYKVRDATINVSSFRGEASRFLYYAHIPEKADALVVITDDAIWVFANTGDLLQSIDFETYQSMGISESALAPHP